MYEIILSDSQESQKRNGFRLRIWLSTKATILSKARQASNSPIGKK